MYYFSDTTFIYTMATGLLAGIACLVLAVSGSMYARALALITAAVCVTAFYAVPESAFQTEAARPYYSYYFLILALGFSAYAMPDGAFQRVLSAASRKAAGRRYEDMDRWLETTERISSRQDTSEIKSFLAEMYGGAIGASQVHVWLYQNSSRSYIANSARIAPTFRTVTPEHAIIEHIKATGGAPFLLEELSEDEVRQLSSHVDAVVCAPLIAHKEIIGFILAARKQGRSGYTEYDLMLMRAIATQAAVQVKNIRLSEDLLDMKEGDLFNRMSSFVAHDLKNLANSLSLLGHNAKCSISDPAFQREALKALDSTAAQMRSLVDKMTGGLKGLDINPGYSDLRKVLERAARRLATSAQERLKVADGTPVMCWVDEDLIETVFLNMLTNASDATADGDEIRVSFDAFGDSLSVVIEDNGSGIPMPFLENGLFRPFRTTKKDGFGIGLYQCKTLMEAHGGSIWVESEEGKGTAFTLKFPAISAGKECGAS